MEAHAQREQLPGHAVSPSGRTGFVSSSLGALPAGAEHALQQPPNCSVGRRPALSARENMGTS